MTIEFKTTKEMHKFVSANLEVFEKDPDAFFIDKTGRAWVWDFPNESFGEGRFIITTEGNRKTFDFLGPFKLNLKMDVSKLKGAPPELIKEGDCFEDAKGDFFIFDENGMHIYYIIGRAFKYFYDETKYIIYCTGGSLKELESLGWKYLGNWDD